MHVAVVGVGNLGAAIAFELLHHKEVKKLTLVETYPPSVKKMNGEFWDLLPVARATGVSLSKLDRVPRGADAIIITAGMPRKSSADSKDGLMNTNLPIVASILNNATDGDNIFIATNPPNELAEWATAKGYSAFPLRACTDQLRQAVGDYKTINANVLDNKGTTQWTAAYAIVNEVLSVMSRKAKKKAKRDLEDGI